MVRNEPVVFVSQGAGVVMLFERIAKGIEAFFGTVVSVWTIKMCWMGDEKGEWMVVVIEMRQVIFSKG